MTKEEATKKLADIIFYAAKSGYMPYDTDDEMCAMNIAKEHIDEFYTSLPSVLDEAAQEYEKKHTYQLYDGGGLTPEYDPTLAEAFIAGYNLCKEQMMKEAVEGYVTLTMTGIPTVAATIKEGDNIGIGDKVRIIIVKGD